ncbi:MAG: biosynthetic arginine decarboxylase [Phycisphaeraceae bacterium]|nr:biosynthetic arginine decarboxylase [Phycisphaeraceae bacterium]
MNPRRDQASSVSDSLNGEDTELSEPMGAELDEESTAAEAPPRKRRRKSREWTARDSLDLYGVRRWSNGYFSVNAEGNATVHPTRAQARAIDLFKLINELRQRGIQVPILLRFPAILKHRLRQVHQVFMNAMTRFEYRGKYRCVYPIKVNQQRHVVEEIHGFGKPYGFGLEAGSKPELLALMAMVDDTRTPIICNGFKDSEFIEAVILAAKIGQNIIPVVEGFHELRLIVHHANLHNVRPTIGIRVKMASRGSGRWEASGGLKSKFGLSIAKVMDALAFLEANGMGDCLKLIHFHLGSQVNNIRSIKRAITEAARVYVELQRSGAKLEYLDVGGGLGVDYDGSKSAMESSVNYSMQEYANDVVYYIKEACEQADVEHPTIITESGRAIASYHSVLVFNVLDVSPVEQSEIPSQFSRTELENMPVPVRTLCEAYRDVNAASLREDYHDAQLAWDQVLHLFNLGYCTLDYRVLAERVFFAFCRKAMEINKRLESPLDDLKELPRVLADTYFCNLSIFQSLPDSWAIDQLFPIMPIHRLNERPNRRGIIADITCDSDGKINRFIGRKHAKTVLELHECESPVDPTVPDDNEYYLAAFLVGAYQEILGDMHNLFGDTNAVHVNIGADGRPRIDEVIEGDTVRDVLKYVQYSADDLKRQMRQRVEQAVQQKKITLEESRLLWKFYESGLEGYTYLE